MPLAEYVSVLLMEAVVVSVKTIVLSATIQCVAQMELLMTMSAESNWPHVKEKDPLGWFIMANAVSP